MSGVLVGFVPVLHQGYYEWFLKHRGASLGLLGPGLYGEFERLTREARALNVYAMQHAIDGLAVFDRVHVYDRPIQLGWLQGQTVHMPDEDISRHVAEKYLGKSEVLFEPWQVRYDLPAAFNKCPPEADRIITVTEFDREMMARAYQESRKSPDWWRQVGAMAVLPNGEVLLSEHNTHMPSEHSLYALGDPRNNFTPGQHLEITCAHHAERGIIAVAAGNGIKLAGSWMYVTTFPCPSCAYSIVRAKVSRIYYHEGYSSVDADKTCKAYGVELVHICEDK
jgi:dCMP deaminase